MTRERPGSVVAQFGPAEGEEGVRVRASSVSPTRVRNAALMPSAVSATRYFPCLVQDAKKANLYYFRAVQKHSSKGKRQDRLLALTGNRLILSEQKGKRAEPSRWPLFAELHSTVLYEDVDGCRQYLFKVPNEGTDMLLVFTDHPKNDPVLAPYEVFEQRLAALFAAAALPLSFEKADGASVAEQANLKKTKAFKESMKQETKRVGSIRRQMSVASGASSTPAGLPPVSPPASPQPFVSDRYESSPYEHDDDCDAKSDGASSPPVSPPARASQCHQADPSQLPMPATIPPKLQKFNDDTTPLYFLRVVEKRSAKGAWQKRVVLLTAGQLLLAELGSTKVKRWTKLEDISSPIRVQFVAGKKGTSVPQYLIKVPSEGVDMLLQFSADDKNDDNATSQLFEERVGEVMRARGLHVEFERVTDDAAPLTEEAQLDKPKEFIQEKKKSTRAFSVGPDEKAGGGGFMQKLRSMSRSPTKADTEEIGGMQRAASPTNSEDGGEYGDPAPARVPDATVNMAQLPFPVSPPPKLASYDGPSQQLMYFIRTVEKRNSKGKWEKRVLVLSDSRLLLAEGVGKNPVAKRWPRVSDITSPIRFKTVPLQPGTRNEATTKEYLIKVPSEGQDMYLRFHEDDKNDPDLVPCEVFEERLDQVCRAWGLNMEFEEVKDGEAPLEKQAQLAKTKEVKAKAEVGSKIVKQQKSMQSIKEERKEARAQSLMGLKAQQSVGPESGMAPSDPADAPAAASEPATSAANYNNDSDEDAAAMSYGLIPEAANPRMLPRTVQPPPALSVLSSRSAPEFFYVRGVEKRNSKGKWERRVVILTENKFLLIEAGKGGNPVMKRWPLLTDIESPILFQKTTLHAGKAHEERGVKQYLIKVPSEGVDMLLQFSADERNVDGDCTDSADFERILSQLRRAWGLNMDYIPINTSESGDTAALEKLAQLDKTKALKQQREEMKQFDKEQRKAAKTEEGEDKRWIERNHSFMGSRPRVGSERPSDESVTRLPSSLKTPVSTGQDVWATSGVPTVSGDGSVVSLMRPEENPKHVTISEPPKGGEETIGEPGTDEVRLMDAEEHVEEAKAKSRAESLELPASPPVSPPAAQPAAASSPSASPSPLRASPRRRDVSAEKLVSENKALRVKAAKLHEYASELAQLCAILNPSHQPVVPVAPPTVPASASQAAQPELLGENHSLREACKLLREDVKRLEAVSAGLSRANPVPSAPIQRPASPKP